MNRVNVITQINMNKIAISLCVLGFATVNAASGSGMTASTAAAAAAPLIAGAGPWSADSAHHQSGLIEDARAGDWFHQDLEECEDFGNDDCGEHKIRIGRAGEGASGTVNSHAVMSSSGAIVIPA